VWLHLTAKDGDKAKCDHCGHEISYRSSTSNLKKHYEAKHSALGELALRRGRRAPPAAASCEAGTSAKSDADNVAAAAAPAASTTAVNCEAGNSTTTSTSTVMMTVIPPSATVQNRKQSSLSSYVVCPASVVRQKRLNNLVLRMIVLDVQPFSIVDDPGFRAFVYALDPSYQLPSRTTISRDLLPAAYNVCVGEVQAFMETVDAVTLTTDSWTSATTENYLAVTAYYLDRDYTLRSCVLECVKFSEQHTADNLANELLRVTREWKVENKVVVVVTDNAANIVSAVKKAGFKHLPCFAHTLNLVVQQGVSCIKTLQQKVKAIVEHFHRSSVAAEKLTLLQFQMHPEKPALKLKNDVVTRWNSTFHMLQRLCEVQEPLEAALGVLHNPVEASQVLSGWRCGRHALY